MAKKSTKSPSLADYPLVALDMGSSSFKAMTATVQEDGTLRIDGCDQSSKFACMKKGLVQNTTSSGFMIGEALHLLANRMGGNFESLSAVYTSLGGQNMGVTAVRAHRMQGMATTLSQSFLDGLREECETKVKRANQDVEAIAAIPAYFEIDGERMPAPLPGGTRAKDVVGVYSVFYARPRLREDVEGSFARANKLLPASFARPAALVEALASEYDEQMGLAIVDFGAETTTITVYKDGQYLRNRVLPLGGKNITMDIQQMGISLQHAEQLKLRCGVAHERYVEKNSTIRIPSAEPGSVPVTTDMLTVNRLISSRVSEILKEVAAVIQPYEDVISQVYITGGASKLPYMVEALKEYTPLEVSYGSHADWLDPSTPEEYYAPEYSALVGTLLLGDKHKKQHGQAAAPTKRKTFVDGVIDLFTYQDN